MILYAIVARAKDGAILAESMIAGAKGNFAQITVEVLERVASSLNHSSALGGRGGGPSGADELLPDGGRRTFVQQHDDLTLCGVFSGGAMRWTDFFSQSGDAESAGGAGMDYYFHLYRRDNVICLCISDDVDARYHAVNFEFLNDLEGQFSKSYAPYKVTKAKAYEMDKKFSADISRLLYFYNENRCKMVRQDKVHDMIEEVDDLTGVLGRNITMILERESKLDDLVAQSDDVLENVKIFKKRSFRLKKTVKRQNKSYYPIAAVFGALVLYLVVAEHCGYTFQKCFSKAE